MFLKLRYNKTDGYINESLKKIINSTDYNFINQELNRVYNMLKDEAKYFYDKKYDFMDELYYKLIDYIFYVENKVPNYFIVNSKPNLVYSLKPDFISAEPHEILDSLVCEARVRFVEKGSFFLNPINLESDTLENECKNISQIFLDVCYKYGILCKLFLITPGFCNDDSLHEGYDYHYACIVTIKNVSYLVDLSYRQFFTLRCNSLDRIGVVGLNNSRPGIFMTLNSNRLETASKILSRGWIPLLEAKDYFDGFVLSYRNIHYYENTKDYSFNVDYTIDNYIDFINNLDSQLNYEGRKILEIQKRPSKIRIK